MGRVSFAVVQNFLSNATDERKRLAASDYSEWNSDLGGVVLRLIKFLND